jgi:SAM-dependent methyltransferase
MDLALRILNLADLPSRALRKLRGRRVDYRDVLFQELKGRLGGAKPRRVLEIGPRDGEDTRRLVTLGAEKLVLIDLPNQKANIDKWLPSLSGAPIELIYGNFMYDRAFDALEPFDVIWCTGVLYHNPEQLRFIRQLFDLVAPGGLLVMETATARRPGTRNHNCVEIWYPADKAASRAYHVSANVTHLPSIKAVESWLDMIGFAEVEKSACHRRVGRALAAMRVAYIAKRPVDSMLGNYYSHVGHDFPLGRAR